MKFNKNITYACQVVMINDEEVNYVASVRLDDEYFTEITINQVDNVHYDKIKKKQSVNIVLNVEGTNITIVDSQLVASACRKYCDVTDYKYNLKYMSSLMLVDYDYIPSKGVTFSDIDCTITEITELLGSCPYKIDYEPIALSDVQCNVSGNAISKVVGHGFSYFVAPTIIKESNELHVSMCGRIHYSGGKERNISEIKEVLSCICLFFEILSGEVITVNDVDLGRGENKFKAIGLCNFPKDKLQKFQSNFDTKSYLRKNIFKISDFGNNIGQAIAEFYSIINSCCLACEAYKQILLDEEIKISTYSKFLKAMQVVEGFQRTKIEDDEKTDFLKKKEELISKLDEEDGVFVNKYTSYFGQTFRKCMKQFTYQSIQIISGLSKNKCEVYDELISTIINDRDIYTHASKTEKPSLTIDKLQAVNYCYKSFFRVLVLDKMGLSTKLIRNRFRTDRKFVAYYKMLFDLEVMKDEPNNYTGEFDEMMW